MKFARYYLKNKEELKQKSKNRCENLPEEEKNKLKEHQRKKYQQLIQYKMNNYWSNKKNQSNKFHFAKYKNELKIWWN